MAADDPVQGDGSMPAALAAGPMAAEMAEQPEVAPPTARAAAAGAGGRGSTNRIGRRRVRPRLPS